MMREEILNEIQQFDEEMGREHLAHSVGLKDDLNMSAIFEKHPSLFARENLTLVTALLKASSMPETRKRNLLLYDFVVGGIIGNDQKQLIDESSTYEAKAHIKVKGKTVPFRQASMIVMNEPKRAQRQKIVDALVPTKKKLTSYAKQSLTREYALLKKLTGKEYLPYYAFIKQLDYPKIASYARQFLRETADDYHRQLDEAMSSIKVPLNDIRKHDLGFYLRAHHFDAYFPKNNLVQTFTKTLAGMGLNIKKQKNILIDAEDRPKKVPRAFCLPLLIPEEVHLVIKPHGGQEDYQTILHEGGHSEHFANTRKDLSYEFKHMGAHNVSETYAFLFEYLVQNPLWLKQFTKMPAKKEAEFLSFMRFNKLAFLRRYAAKVLYELKLHESDLHQLDDNFLPTREKYADVQAMYADILTKASHVKYLPIDYLLDVDSGMYSADYFLAWMFEVQLRSKLVEKFGAKWFMNKKAGAFLKTMWQYGSAGKSQEELALMIGFSGVDPSFLINEMTQAI